MSQYKIMFVRCTNIILNHVCMQYKCNFVLCVIVSVQHFKVETNDLCDLEWSPDDSIIAIWDTPLEFNLLFYCPRKGLMARFQPYQFALGIKSVQFSQDGSCLAVGAYDETIRLYNCLTHKMITTLAHKKDIQQNEQLYIFLEEKYQTGGPFNRA